MEELGRLTERQRADAATRAIEQLPKGRLSQYAPLVRGLPSLLHQHGLGQTLVYLLGRGAERADSPYSLLYGQLGSWLMGGLGEQGGDILATLTRVDSRRYLEAAEEAHAFALALREAIQKALAPESAEEVAE